MRAEDCPNAENSCVSRACGIRFKAAWGTWVQGGGGGWGWEHLPEVTERSCNIA
jgi:hypothetical protein